MNEEIKNWLLSGDISIQYQVYRDLLSNERPDLQLNIEKEGWGAEYLSKRREDGHWGLKFYQPKWTSSNYTLLDLKNLCISPDHKLIRETVELIAEKEKGADGGINPSGTIGNSDACINGMFLNYGCYFKLNENKLKSVVDFLLNQVMPDGGFNCRLNRSGATHSSVHTTISVLEGITEYEKNGYTYRLNELLAVKSTAIEFLLIHELYKSDRTGNIINPAFLRLPYPPRWKYDILRALDYFQYSKIAWDERMKPALEVLMAKRKPDGRWLQNAHHPGKIHFQMDIPGKPGRWNTLRALRVLTYYGENL